MSDRTIDGLRYRCCQLREEVDVTGSAFPQYTGPVYATLQCRRCHGAFLDDEAARFHICVPQQLTPEYWRQFRVQHQAPVHERLNKLGEDLLLLAADLEVEARRPK